MTTISVSLDEMDDSQSVQTDALNDNNTDKKHKKHVKRKAKNTSSNNTTTTTTNTKKRNEEKKGAGKSSSKGRAFRVLKHKRRYCREPGCDKIVKSQGLCQRHGAKPKKCSVVECIKQAQGSYNGMCSKFYIQIKPQFQVFVHFPSLSLTTCVLSLFCRSTRITLSYVQ